MPFKMHYEAKKMGNALAVSYSEQRLDTLERKSWIVWHYESVRRGKCGAKYFEVNAVLPNDVPNMQFEAKGK